MLRTSVPFGRILNVEVRVHLSFFLLLALSIGFSIALHGGPLRGLAIWLALCLAVLVREIARCIAVACAGLHLSAIFLLPVGGVMAFQSRDGVAFQGAGSGQPNLRWITASGPIANFAVALLMVGFTLGVDPRISLFMQPWISLGHVLRSFVWTQILLGAVSLLPTQAMPARQLLRAIQPVRSTASPATSASRIPAGGPAFRLGTAVAIVLILAGILLPAFFWLIILGSFLLLYVQVSNVQATSTPAGDAILVRDVMLTEYSLLSSSDTLSHALGCTVHCLQDTFPVVRGDRLVGSIARQTIAERLHHGGDSYLQGAMLRNLPLATPNDNLVDALRRAGAAGASDFIPVIENNMMVGILTPQSLGRAIQQVKLTRLPARQEPS